MCCFHLYCLFHLSYLRYYFRWYYLLSLVVAALSLVLFHLSCLACCFLHCFHLSCLRVLLSLNSAFTCCGWLSLATAFIVVLGVLLSCYCFHLSCGLLLVLLLSFVVLEVLLSLVLLLTCRARVLPFAFIYRCLRCCFRWYYCSLVRGACFRCY